MVLILLLGILFGLLLVGLLVRLSGREPGLGLPVEDAEPFDLDLGVHSACFAPLPDMQLWSDRVQLTAADSLGDDVGPAAIHHGARLRLLMTAVVVELEACLFVVAQRETMV